jgi:predicted DNA-binding ribbon-helix-helix protein
MKVIVKRAVVVGGRKTSVSLEDPFWHGFKALARQQGRTLSDLISEIDRHRQHTNLSSAIRLHVLHHLQQLAARMTTAAKPAEFAGLPSNGSVGERVLGNGAESRRPSFWEW